MAVDQGLEGEEDVPREPEGEGDAHIELESKGDGAEGLADARDKIMGGDARGSQLSIKACPNA